MPNTTINVVQSDSGYPLNFTLQNNAGVAIDLTGTTVSIKAQLFNSDLVKFSGTLALDVAASGTCHYTVQANDFDTEGRYKIELTITYVSGETLSYVNIIVVAAPKLPAA